MNEETLKLLTVSRLPARLTSDQAASLLGFAPHDMPVLVGAGLLRPLGNPLPNTVKYHAAFEIEQNCRDEKWLHKATKATCAHWARQNKKRREKEHGACGSERVMTA